MNIGLQSLVVHTILSRMGFCSMHNYIKHSYNKKIHRYGFLKGNSLITIHKIMYLYKLYLFYINELQPLLSCEVQTNWQKEMLNSFKKKMKSAKSVVGLLGLPTKAELAVITSFTQYLNSTSKLHRLTQLPNLKKSNKLKVAPFYSKFNKIQNGNSLKGYQSVMIKYSHIRFKVVNIHDESLVGPYNNI